MNEKQFSDYIARLEKDIREGINTRIPQRVANAAVRMFKENFQNESFFGKPWKDVKRRQVVAKTYKTPGGRTKTRITTVGKGAAGRRKILTGPTGNLGRSIQFKIEGTRITVFSDLPYSSAHNDGTSNAGRNHRVKIPQRQFIGDHPKLRKEIETTIIKQLNSIFK